MDAGDTKARIVETAMLLLGEKGSEAFSAAALARETGVSKANIFHHFPHIEEVPQAALEVLAKRVKSDPAPSTESDLDSWLRELGNNVLEAVADNRSFLNAYFVFFSKALFDERLRPPMTRCLEYTQSIVEERLRSELNGEDATEVAALSAAVLDGLVMRSLVMGDDAAADRIWSSFVDRVLSGSDRH